MRNFMQLLKERQAKGFRVCVGLDPVASKMPDHMKENFRRDGSFVEFCQSIFNATSAIAAAFKPNIAFFEALGKDGHKQLRDIIGYGQHWTPEVPWILDAKRGDIGNTNDGYVASAFDFLGADAITVHPYMGKESLKPFLDQKDKGIFILCRTSNPGAGEFQNLEVKPKWDGENFGYRQTTLPLYQFVAHQVATEWNTNGNCCLVVGATAPEELAMVRKIAGPADMPILIPGIGAQGGDIEKTVRAGGENIIVNLSRSVLYASSGDDFAEAARKEVERVHEEINGCLWTNHLV